MQKPDTEFKAFKKMSIWGPDGKLTFSIKNGYPRFTYFHKEEQGKFITAPLDVLSMAQVASIIKVVANSKEDVKYSIICKNRDYTTKEIVLQAILIIARRGDDIYIGIKPTHEAKAITVKIDMPLYVEIIKDEETTPPRIAKASRAIAYADYILFLLAEYCVEDGDGLRIPNSDRANPSNPPVSAPVSNTDAIDDTAVSEIDDIGY